MLDQADQLRTLMKQRVAHATPDDRSTLETTCRTIAVTSGKGGVGKTNIALNLAIALAQLDVRVCLLDANLGLGNVDLLCGLNGYWNLSHVVTGARTLSDVLLDGPGGIHVVPGASGLTELADCSPAAQQHVLHQLQQLERDHDLLVLDTASGIHRSVRGFLADADAVLVTTTPEPTSVADAYATVKTLAAGDVRDVQVLVNQAESSRQAAAVFDRLKQTARLFGRIEVASAGFLPHDPHVVRAVASRRPFLTHFPHCPASQAVRQLARRLQHSAASAPTQGNFFGRFCRRLIGRAA